MLAQVLPQEFGQNKLHNPKLPMPRLRLQLDWPNLPANPCSALQALLEREGLGSTGVGQGVALPHARIRDLSAVSGVFMLLEKPIDFGAVDRQPVDVVFCLFAPEAAGVEHLKALALVSRTLREPSICAKLRANPDAAKIYTILTELERDRAA